MIIYGNIQRHDDKPFEEYLKLGGYSHSWLKHQKNGVCAPIHLTDNMRTGSIVDAILTEPHKVNMSDPLYPACKAIAFKVREQFGDMIKVFQKQISYTAEATYGGLTIKTTGRLDFLLPKHAVVDLKITQSKDIPALVEFMGYKNQGWHYCKNAQVKDFYLMVHSVPLAQTKIIYYDCSSDYNEFWANKIMDFGTVKNG